MNQIELKEYYMDEETTKKTIRVDVMENSKLNKVYLHTVKSSPQSLHFKCKIKQCHFHVTYNLEKHSFVWQLGQSINSHNHDYIFNFKCVSVNGKKKVGNKKNKTPLLKEARQTIHKVKADGFCGYRAVSLALFQKKHNFKKVIQQMIKQLEENWNTYIKLGFEVSKLQEILGEAIKFKTGKVLPQKWYYNGVECSQLVADAFNVAVTVVSQYL